jgi:hypothetical protein
MSHVQFAAQVNIDLNEVLNGVAQLNLFELEQFASQVNRLLAQRKAPHLSKSEAELLQKINQALPTKTQRRFDELNDKRRDEQLTAIEHQELLTLIEQIELRDAERLECLIELAQLRGVLLETLMAQLGIHSPAYA